MNTRRQGLIEKLIALMDEKEPEGECVIAEAKADVVYDINDAIEKHRTKEREARHEKLAREMDVEDEINQDEIERLQDDIYGAELGISKERKTIEMMKTITEILEA